MVELVQEGAIAIVINRHDVTRRSLPEAALQLDPLAHGAEVENARFRACDPLGEGVLPYPLLDDLRLLRLLLLLLRLLLLLLRLLLLLLRLLLLLWLLLVCFLRFLIELLRVVVTMVVLIMR